MNREACLLPFAIACLILPSIAMGRPVDPPSPADIQELRPALPPSVPATSGLMATTSSVDTVFFGGTFWNADSSRWEAIEDSIWTFDSGVGSHFNHAQDGYPNKSPGLHALMEGWVGVDNTLEVEAQFRRLTATDFASSPTVCVGTAAGLGGSASLWAGLTEPESILETYFGGQGYGNNWDIVIEREFQHPGGPGSVQLEYDYVADVEPGFDYVYVVVDTSGAGDEVDVALYNGDVSGHASITLTPGVSLRSDAGPFRIRFRVESDGAYSDRDALYNTDCGAFAVDDIELSGLVAAGPFTFETGDDGWSVPAPAPPVDFSDIMSLASLPDETPGCPCSLQDSVLVFAQSQLTHVEGHENVAVSPWIDLKAAGLVGVAGRVLECDVLGILGAAGPTLLEFQVQWYPYADPVSGLDRVSDMETLLYGGRGDDPVCYSPIRIDLGSRIPPEAERVRVAIGVQGGCFYPPCSTHPDTQTPWVDNVRFGVFEVPGIELSILDRFEDAFPTDGTLNPSSPARLDRGAPAWSGIDDTLVVRAAGAGLEVEVVFAVSPGPGIDTARLNQWLGTHPVAVTWEGLDWRSARLDSCEVGGVLSTARWMTTYHESDPNFMASDTAQDPNDPGRLLNDIFPDDLLTPGSRLGLFVRARQNGGSWTVYPDTSGGTYFETEILPSSLQMDGTQNCLLFVNSGWVGVDPAWIEDALSALYPASSTNFEATAWDRLDAIASPVLPPASQLSGYKAIVWSSDRNVTNLVDSNTGLVPDEDRLTQWLESDPVNGKGAYFTGDSVPEHWDDGALNVMEEYLGIGSFCYLIRKGGCNGLASWESEDADCLALPAAPDVHFSPTTPYSVSGNACSAFRFMDRLYLGTPSLGTAKANLSWSGPAMGVVDYASITHEVAPSGQVTYRTVTDGASLFRWTAGCAGADAVQTRLAEVLTWIGLPPGSACAGVVTSVPPNDLPQRKPARFLLLSPHPVTSAASFRLEGAGGERTWIDVYGVTGRRVRRLLDEDGVTDLEVSWDLSDNSGRRVAPGIYFVKVSGGVQASRRILVLR